MSTRVSLQYPNGRTHHCDHERNLHEGDQFDLFGRRWTVVGLEGRKTRYGGAPRRILCRQSR